MVYSWTYTDCAGNSHVWTHTVTVDVPDFTMPANTTATATCVANIVAPTPPAVNDFCGRPITPVAGTAPAPVACEGDMVYSWTYTDCAGNSHVWTHTVTVDVPDFTMPANTTATATCVANIVAPTPPAVNDFCGRPITPVAGTAPAPVACEGDMVYSWTYTDCAGNSHVWTHTVTVDVPDFTMPANTTATATCVANIVAPTPPAVNDFCGRPITPVAGTAPAPVACEGDMVYSWTYTDCAGNSHVWTHTVTVDVPDFTMPANTTATATCVANIVAPSPSGVHHDFHTSLTPLAAALPAPVACEGD